MRIWVLAYFSVILAVGVLLGTGLVSDWGEWYSVEPGYRMQTEAFLDGTVAVSNNPQAIPWDMAWARERVQQVWGLGVPAWRLPFEAVARVFGQPAFPDRFAFGIAFALLSFAVLKLFFVRPGEENALDVLKHRPERFCAPFLLLLFPPFLTLCQTRFLAYEEASAYSFLAGIALFVGTVCFVRKPTLAIFLVLGFLAGLVGFVRPTLLVYGAGSVLVAWVYSQHLGWRYWRSGLGIAAFGLGVGLLLLSNLHRFGSGMEFGHSLNLNGIDAMRFTTRFDDPFGTEPLWRASTELLSSMFFVGDRMNGYAWYEDDFFPGQSSTIRWREFYFSTYDLSFGFNLIAVWGIGLWRVAGWWKSRGVIVSEVDVMIWWSLLATAPLFLFYLRAPVMASRYLLDFAPAFAVALLGGVFLLAQHGGRWMRGRRWAGVAVVALWWLWQVYFASNVMPAGRAFTQERVLAEEVLRAGRDARSFSASDLPDSYVLGMEAPGPGFNLAGWNLETGAAKAAVIVFLPTVRKLELAVSPAEGAELALEDYDQVQVKVGLEFLKRAAVEETEDGARLIFDGPKHRIYQSGLQVCFIGFATAQNVTYEDSQFRLLRVGWEEGRE